MLENDDIAAVEDDTIGDISFLSNDEATDEVTEGTTEEATDEASEESRVTETSESTTEAAMNPGHVHLLPPPPATLIRTDNHFGKRKREENDDAECGPLAILRDTFSGEILPRSKTMPSPEDVDSMRSIWRRLTDCVDL